MLSEPTSAPPQDPACKSITREHMTGSDIPRRILQQTCPLSDQPLEQEGRPGRQETNLSRAPSFDSRLQGPFPTWLGASCPIRTIGGINQGTPGPGRLLGHHLQHLRVSVISPSAGRQGCWGILKFLDPGLADFCSQGPAGQGELGLSPDHCFSAVASH